MQVLIPTPLRSYTAASRVEAAGATLGELLADLDRRYPGIRFRMVDEQDRLRPHIRVFVNGTQARDLGLGLAPADDVAIVQALSGG
ncbi:MAG: MoaD/ThiS family protein [Burkholderiaceae bacterium]|nr:MoaD/ThiS family protein [Burkholderiaceae bacterium]